MTLALHGKTRARQCAFFGAALAAVVAAAVAGGVLPGAERSGAAAYSASSYAGSASSASGHWTNPANATGAQNGSGAITTTGGKVIVLVQDVRDSCSLWDWARNWAGVSMPRAW